MKFVVITVTRSREYIRRRRHMYKVQMGQFALTQQLIRLKRLAIGFISRMFSKLHVNELWFFELVMPWTS